MFRMHLGTGMRPQCLPGPYPLSQEPHTDLFACILFFFFFPRSALPATIHGGPYCVPEGNMMGSKTKSFSPWTLYSAKYENEKKYCLVMSASPSDRVMWPGTDWGYFRAGRGDTLGG